ncbi:MAG: hypothetical protein U0746_03765 [Gemmataceae bacterium]
MTDAIPDITARFTPEAAARFKEYLAHARTALAGCEELSPDEVEQDIRAHVAAEFPPGSGWVRLDQLESVLARLGRPEQWVSDGGPPAWRRGMNWVRARPAAVRRGVHSVAAQLRNGPDDWRLAYLTFGLFIVGVIVFPLAVVLLPASYLLARAAVSLARERGTSLGSQRWLVYTPLVIVSAPLLVGLVLWPIGLGGTMAEDVWRHNQGDIQEAMDLPRGLCEFLTFVYFIAGTTSLWNLLIGSVFWAFPRLPAALFAPFFHGDNRKPGRVLALTGGVVFALWLSFTVRAMPVAEWLGEWKRSTFEREGPVRVSRPGRADRVVLVPEAEPARDAVERRAKKVTTDFLRACRNREVGEALRLADTPFYTGSVVSGSLLVPDAGPILRDTSRLQVFLDGQLRQVRRTDPMPNEVLSIVSYEDFKMLDADVTLTAVLDEVLHPTDFVVVVGRDGKQTGRIFVRVQNGCTTVAGMMK